MDRNKKSRLIKKRNDNSISNKSSNSESINDMISSSLKENIDSIRNILSNSDDLVIHEFYLEHNIDTESALIFIEGMIDKDAINENVLKSLMYGTQFISAKDTENFENIDVFRKKLLAISGIEKASKIMDAVDKILSGYTILLVDGLDEALVINEKGWKERNVDEPQTENVVRGPREGFTENIKVNTILIRRKIKTPDLCIDSVKIGEKTKTQIRLMYIKNITNPKLVDEVKTRLNKINIDAILESGYIEQLIEDANYSIFSTMGNTEKPDRAAAKILEGRVAILIDGSPFVLTVPMLFIESFQSTEDYYSRPFFASFIRLLRFIAFVISLFSPAAYVALTVYHQELIPTELLISIAAGREPIPFPAWLEAFLMIFTFDMLREAGVRLPKPVGPAVSIVGALVLGQAAVQAGLISPIMVIVVSGTAISSFVVPAQTDSGTILRYFYLILAALAGGFGILMGAIVTILHLASLRSFGSPYLSPIAPFSPSEMKDTFIRMPLNRMRFRPKSIIWHKSYRQGMEIDSLNKEENINNSKK